MRIVHWSIGTLAAAVVAGALSAPALAQERIALGYGSNDLRPLALALCRAVSEGTDYRCATRRGLMPSDPPATGPALFIAYADTVDGDMRAVLPLHVEPVAVVARAEAEIGGFADLAGARVNVGAAGTSGRAAMDRLIAAADWTADAFSVATGLDATAQAAALCANQLDAGVVALTADPMESPAGLAGCNVVFVPVAAADGLATTVIPAGVNGNDAEVATVGRSLELVTAAGADIDAVHAVTAAIVGNLDDLRARYRALDAVDAVRVTESVALPLHDGAVRYHTAPPEEEASDDASDTATEPAPETEGGASEDSAPPAQ